MFFSSIRHSTIQLLLPAILILLTSNLANANHGVAQILSQQTAAQSAEVKLIKAQLDLELWKHTQLKELHESGFASWLELRRHQFKIDTINVQLKSAGDFHALLSEASEYPTSLIRDQAMVYRDRQSRPVKIFAPDSQRLVGWIETQSPNESGELHSNEAAIKAAEEKLTVAQKRFEAAICSDAISVNSREKASLELTLARRELEYLQSLEPLRSNRLHPSNGSDVVDLRTIIGDLENFVTADHTDGLQLATLKVQQAEANASGHIKSAQIMLTREQRRADAVGHLHSQGHASAKELEIVSERVSETKSQLDRLLSQQKILKNTLKTSPGDITDSLAPGTFAANDSVTHWPDVVLKDEEFATHLLGLRRELFNEIAIGETNRLKTEFLLDVLERLKLAASKSSTASRTGSVLDEGQRNEIESYKLDIEFAKASRLAALETQQILIHEENRFIQQAIALHNAARDEIASSKSLSWNALGMLSQIYPATVVTSSVNPKPLARYSYLEWDELRDVGESNDLASARSSLRLVDSTYSYQSLELFNLAPVRSSRLTSDAIGSQTSRGRLNVQPHWMKYFDRNLRQNSDTVLRLSGPPYADSWPQKVFYGQYGYRPFGGTYGYPNGILRADWRSNLTPGIVPWYAPGSPANIRANQLHYRRDGKPYQRW